MKSLLIAAITLILSACSGVTPYPDLPKKNFSIRAITDSGSLIKDVKASLDIHSVKPDCSTVYIGTVMLDKPAVEIGIPVKKPSYLSFTFNTSGAFSANSGSMTTGTLFTAKPGYRYTAKVSYIDEIYDVVITEMNPGGQGRELELKDLDDCKQ